MLISGHPTCPHVRRSGGAAGGALTHQARLSNALTQYGLGLRFTIPKRRVLLLDNGPLGG
jgi:hypothetical protein